MLCDTLGFSCWEQGGLVDVAKLLVGPVARFSPRLGHGAFLGSKSVCPRDFMALCS